MIAAPPPCVAMESVLCVATPFSDVLVSRLGIISSRIPAAQHEAAVASLGVEVLDDGPDGLITEPPPSQELKFCQGSVCIRYAMSCGGGAETPYCAVTLHLPNVSRSPRVPPDEMLRRDVAIRARSRQAFEAAVQATYIVVREPEETLIPMSKLIPIKKGSK